MDSRRYLQAQTDILDSFLPELSRSSVPNSEVNFNNTRQFDALLRALELSLESPVFVAVPSTSVLHILFTLSCRCPTSNWTHKLAHLDGISASTDYMKQVNSDYDHTLYKMLIQDRSCKVLQTYVEVMESNLSGSGAVQDLISNFDKVIQKLTPISIKTFFSPKKTKPKQEEPTLDILAARVSATLLGLPKLAVVEVISDSEESDSILDVVEPTEIALKYRSFNLPLRSVTSLSDLGSNTSGLGETTQLFKNMPHLLATVTPEPEEVSRNHKRPKLMANPINQIQIYDDFLLAKKLQLSDTYDMWNLLRWCFECADSASEYQKFLFNSNQTNAHRIYCAYEAFFQIYFDYLSVSLTNGGNTKKQSALEHLLTLLGPKMDWYDRAVEYTFTGLEIQTNSRAFPCYDRERLLMKHDPATLVSRCKTTVEFLDNLHSMLLRCRIMCLLYCQAKSETDITELMRQLTMKVMDLDIRYVEEFFKCFVGILRMSRLPQEKIETFATLLARSCLASLTGMEVPKFDMENQEKDTENLAKFLENESLFSSLSDDLSYKSFFEFEEKWKKVVFLVGWILTSTLTKEQIGCRQEILSAASKADENRRKCYLEFLESRLEDADVRAEDINFTLSKEEVQKYSATSQTSFKLQVELLL